MTQILFLHTTPVLRLFKVSRYWNRWLGKGKVHNLLHSLRAFDWFARYTRIALRLRNNRNVNRFEIHSSETIMALSHTGAFESYRLYLQYGSRPVSNIAKVITIDGRSERRSL